MALQENVFTTSQMLGVFYDPEGDKVPNYWLNLCFGSEITFETEYIDFTRISRQRKLAPLVVPTEQGSPIWSAAETRTQVKPAYVKPKDAISATRVIKKVAGFGEMNYRTQMTPAARYRALVADILLQHKQAIERRWEWLASEAIQHGQVTLSGEKYPTTVVAFGRDAGHSINLTGAARWGQAGVDILGNIESWKKTVRNAKFGGPTNRLTVGTEAWDIMRNDSEVREQLKTDYKPGTFNNSMNLGVLEGLEVEWVGRIAGTTDVYVYSDYYEDEAGTITPFMDPRDVVLTGPGVQGVRCFAAIQDIGADLQPLKMFPKMWPQQDPSATFIMTQSAPLMVPVNPNATLRARVQNNA